MRLLNFAALRLRLCAALFIALILALRIMACIRPITQGKRMGWYVEIEPGYFWGIVSRKNNSPGYDQVRWNARF